MTKHLVENYLKEIVMHVFVWYVICVQITVTEFTISVWIYNHLMRNKSFLVLAVRVMSPSLLFSVEVLG